MILRRGARRAASSATSRVLSPASRGLRVRATSRSPRRGPTRAARASGVALIEHALRLGARARLSTTVELDWRVDEPARVHASGRGAASGRRFSACAGTSSRPLMPRVPLLSGSRLAVVNVRRRRRAAAAPRPPEAVADVAAAVRDALRFPLAGQPLEALVRAAARATIVVEPPALPIPGALGDPRRAALAATSTSSSGSASPTSARRSSSPAGSRGGRRSASSRRCVAPEFARRFHGQVEVHDAEAPELVDLGEPGARRCASTARSSRPTSSSPSPPPRPCCTAGRRRCSAPRPGGAARGDRLLAARDRRPRRAGSSRVALERALARRVPRDRRLARAQPAAAHGPLPRLPVRGRRRSSGSPARRCAALSRPARPGSGAGCSSALGRELTAVAAFAGPPSVAHAEALLRGIERRATPRSSEPLDAIVIGIPQHDAVLPRERPNPSRPRTSALGLALRLWRDALPGRGRRHGDPAAPALSATSRTGTQQPYRAFFHATPRRAHRRGPRRGRARGGRRRAGARGLPRRPRLPSAAAVRRLGRLPAGARPARRRPRRRLPRRTRRRGSSASCRRTASRRALEMARGRAGGEARIGFLLAPPYFPLEVGAGA